MPDLTLFDAATTVPHVGIYAMPVWTDDPRVSAWDYARAAWLLALDSIPDQWDAQSLELDGAMRGAIAAGPDPKWVKHS